MDTPLLLTKICLPPARLVGSQVPRQHLLARLNEGVRLRRRLILVSAPAGFGKTTLVSAWARQVPARAAWVSLDHDDNDVVRFLSYLIASCQAVQPDVGKTAVELLEAMQPPEVILTSLINDLASMSESLWIILDDYHLISLLAIHEATAYLLEHLPANVHLLLSTRADPPLPLARLRARGELTELRAADLRFSVDETAAFLEQVMGLNLSDEDMAALENRTEGWVAGLQLAALSLQNHASPQAFIQAFTGSHRHIADYLLEEVLHRQPPETQTFLLQTSILEELTAPLCETLTGRSDSASQLETLERANLFLIPQDEERRWYRYHHLFADLLQLRLQQTSSAEEIAALHRLASDWYAKRRLTPEAMRHALAAAQTTHDYTSVTALMTRAAGRALRRGEVATLLHWLEIVPESERRVRRDFAYFYAFALLLSGQLETVEAWLQAAEEALPGTDAVEEQEFKSASAALRTLLADYQGDVARTIELGQAALAHMTEDDLIPLGIVTLSLADAYRWSGDFGAATQAYAQAVSQNQCGQNLNGVIDAYHNWAEIRLALGQLCQTEAHYGEARRFAESVRLRSRAPIMGVLDLGEAKLAYERNELETATNLWRTGQAYSQQLPHMEGLLEEYQLGLRLCLARGQIAGASVQMEAIAHLLHSRSVPYLRVLAADSQVRFWTAQANTGSMEKWATGLERDCAAAAWPMYLQFLADRALARAWLALEQPERALPALDVLRQQAEEAGWQGEVIIVALLQARAHAALVSVEPAHSALLHALTLAQPEGYIRTFVDEGSVISRLLEEQQSDAETPTLAAYIATLLEAFREPRSRQLADAQALVEPLSDREQEVLCLIDTGLTNAEIAEALVVAVSTIKTHINNIYGKLGVRTREEAIDHAHKLGLL
jgi:LuxR family maltose regulon positive regulatory protein